MPKSMSIFFNSLLKISEKAIFVQSSMPVLLMRRLHVCTIILFLLSSLSHPFLCNSDDRLTAGEFIAVNETLISDGGAFVLGFFSPTNSSSNLYVGIWYNNMPQKTVIWVANRDSPISDPSSTIRISNNANLVLVDSKGDVFWSSNISVLGSLGNDTAAVLLNTGNLILRKGFDNTLWQSFDHPTDTFIPGMKIQFNYTNKSAQSITSWKTETDPSPGSFSFGVDPNSSLQLFIWNGSRPYWRSQAWNGALFSAKAISGIATYLTIMATDSEIYMTLSVSDTSSIIRYQLEHSGELKLLSFDDTSKKWNQIIQTIPFGECETYGHCGPFGYCDSSADPPTCKCLEGFEPKVVNDWNNRNFSEGCTRKNTLQCGDGDGFLRLPSMKVPDHFVYIHNRSISECESECRNNCSCTAYAHATLNITNSSTIPRCLIWIGELIDTEMIASGGDNHFYLRLVISEPGSSGEKRKTRIILAVVPLCAVALICLSAFCLWNSCDEIKGLFKGQKVTLQNDLSSDADFPDSNEFREGKHDHHSELPLFNFLTIANSTNNFSDSHLLGQGGFGKVYKGKLSNGQCIAVKRLSRGSGQGLEEFKNEVILIAKLQHKNLVTLLGCCIQGEERLLVYEYLPNKSLDFFLFDPDKKTVLDWGRRFNIIKGIARALLYLHQDSRLRVIHRDLKASNILLDQEMNAKVSDFGMARIFGGNQHQASTNRVVGTYGYMSPEYAMEGIYSLKSDIYSFGVLLLELVSGFRNTTFHLIVDSPNILAYAWELWNKGMTRDLIDSTIAESCSLDEALRSIIVALLCVQDSPQDRPSMSSIVFMLENEINAYPAPKQPLFTIQRKFGVDGLHLRMNNAGIHSVNDVTITTIQGR